MMLRLLRAESLKYRHGLSPKLLILAPVSVMLLSFGLSRGYFQINTFNWWYTLILPGCIALLAALSNQKDGKKLNYQNLYSLPMALSASWFAKLCLVAIYTLAACGVLLLGVICFGEGLKYLLPGAMSISPLQAVLGMIVLFLTSLWQVPVCFMLAKKLGFLGAVLGNAGVGGIAGVFMAEEPLWLLMPYSWAPRAMCPLLGIRPNNLLVEPGSPLLELWVVPVAIGLSLAFCALLTLGCLWWLGRKEAI